MRKSVTLILKHPVPVWRPVTWPTNSPDLAPLDYGIWPINDLSGSLQVTCGICAIMKRKINAAWQNADPEKIRKICPKNRPKLEGCQKWQFNRLKTKNFYINYKK